jgi:hypothetical protein
LFLLWLLCRQALFDGIARIWHFITRQER